MGTLAALPASGEGVAGSAWRGCGRVTPPGHLGDLGWGWDSAFTHLAVQGLDGAEPQACISDLLLPA